MNINQPFVSIVTPVHNGERYLSECIESVLSQTYCNFEYIIVNNFSTDSSLKIALNYAKFDKRIKIQDNIEFMTSLQNFNNSMRQISGQSRYCKVVHADDWLYPECVEKMVNLAETHPSVGIVSSYRLVNNKVESDGLPYERSVFSGQEIARMNLTSGPYTFGSPSALLICSDLIRSKEKFYNETHTGADTEVCLELLQQCDFGFVHQVLSFSRLHDQAITGKNKSLQTRYANFFYVYKKYAPIYLSQAEYEKGVRNHVRAYYRFLGSQITRWNDLKFWDYHRNAMENLLEIKFSRTKVLQGAAFMGLRRLVDMKQNLKSVTKALLPGE